MTTNKKKTELRLDERGQWAVRSSSSAICYLDLDSMRLLRDRGPDSSPMPYDGLWVPLVSVSSTSGSVGVIRVGDRHKFMTDPAGGVHDYRLWIPRTCTAIEPVEIDELPGRNAAPPSA
ncbi:hypothetical protein [Cellulomonas fengjieae]|uniref:hypothetical protein n=1 Tax=Cellulomonas fengjieae TaxID=2819978 RepID=UPI001AAF61F3|nr:hypothetical protein [Cellulomonas fengjieae]MBO3102575.1 hypothetical protein [Cellulomonas fengjieae]